MISILIFIIKCPLYLKKEKKNLHSAVRPTEESLHSFQQILYLLSMTSVQQILILMNVSFAFEDRISSGC